MQGDEDLVCRVCSTGFKEFEGRPMDWIGHTSLSRPRTAISRTAVQVDKIARDCAVMLVSVCLDSSSLTTCAMTFADAACTMTSCLLMRHCLCKSVPGLLNSSNSKKKSSNGATTATTSWQQQQQQHQQQQQQSPQQR